MSFALKLFQAAGAALFSRKDDPLAPPDVDPKWLPAIEAFKKFIKEHPEQVVLMGWNHDDKTLQRFLRSKQVADVLIENFQHVGIEAEPEFQSLITAFTWSRDPTTFAITGIDKNNDRDKAINRAHDAYVAQRYGVEQRDLFRWYRRLNQNGTRVEVVDRSPRTTTEGDIYTAVYSVPEDYNRLLADIINARAFLPAMWAIISNDNEAFTKITIKILDELEHSTDPSDIATFAQLQAYRHAHDQKTAPFSFARRYDPDTARKILSLIEHDLPQSRIFVPFGGDHLSQCGLSLQGQLGDKAATFYLFLNRAEYETFLLKKSRPDLFGSSSDVPMVMENVLLLEEGVMIHPDAPKVPADLAANCARIGPAPALP
jgi:hypothetical protein